jgi:hypothetical protein
MRKIGTVFVNTEGVGEYMSAFINAVLELLIVGAVYALIDIDKGELKNGIELTLLDDTTRVFELAV